MRFQLKSNVYFIFFQHLSNGSFIYSQLNYTVYFIFSHPSYTVYFIFFLHLSNSSILPFQLEFNASTMSSLVFSSKYQIRLDFFFTTFRHLSDDVAHSSGRNSGHRSWRSPPIFIAGLFSHWRAVKPLPASLLYIVNALHPSSWHTFDGHWYSRNLAPTASSI